MAFQNEHSATLAGTSLSKDNPGTRETIGEFVTQLAREYFMDGPDRRSEPRYRITLPVIVEPLNEELKPTGLRFRAVTRDISEGGIGLICQDPVSGTLKLEISSPSGIELNVIAEVNRCESVGYYFNVGCEVVTDQF